jgi:hypothetical protein
MIERWIESRGFMTQVVVMVASLAIIGVLVVLSVP